LETNNNKQLQAVMRLDQQQNKIQFQAKTNHYDIASAALNKVLNPFDGQILTAEPFAMTHPPCPGP